MNADEQLEFQRLKDRVAALESRAVKFTTMTCAGGAGGAIPAAVTKEIYTIPGNSGKVEQPQYREPTIEDAREFERIYWGSGVNIRLSCLEILNQLGFVRKVQP